MKPRPWVSIIVPSYNGAKRLACCLAALDGQKVTFPFEIIVVLDGSTDNSADVIRQFPGVRMIGQANAGPAAARNRGVQMARGDLIAFTDDDCVPVETWLVI